MSRFKAAIHYIISHLAYVKEETFLPMRGLVVILNEVKNLVFIVRLPWILASAGMTARESEAAQPQGTFRRGAGDFSPAGGTGGVPQIFYSSPKSGGQGVDRNVIIRLDRVIQGQAHVNPPLAKVITY